MTFWCRVKRAERCHLCVYLVRVHKPRLTAFDARSTASNPGVLYRVHPIVWWRRKGAQKLAWSETPHNGKLIWTGCMLLHGKKTTPSVTGSWAQLQKVLALRWILYFKTQPCLDTILASCILLWKHWQGNHKTKTVCWDGAANGACTCAAPAVKYIDFCPKCQVFATKRSNQGTRASWRVD